MERTLVIRTDAWIQDNNEARDQERGEGRACLGELEDRRCVNRRLIARIAIGPAATRSSVEQVLRRMDHVLAFLPQATGIL